MLTIRAETPGDFDSVRRVNERAFGTPLEAGLVDELRDACPDAVSLVATEDGAIVGHILFTPVTIDGERIGAMGLAPMAVEPERQRRGIGGGLIRAGLDLLRERDCPLVVVLGHPEYYPRFGFRPSGDIGLRCQWEGVPEGVFMALVLGAPSGGVPSGEVRYHEVFDRAI